MFFAYIVEKTWAVDCNVGIACANAAQHRKDADEAALGKSCIDDELFQLAYTHSGPREPTMIHCAQLQRIHRDLVANGVQPFARGAHKAVFEASFHGMPIVVKQMFAVHEQEQEQHREQKKHKNRTERRHVTALGGSAEAEQRKRNKNKGGKKNQAKKARESQRHTFKRQVLDEYFYIRSWAPNALERSPFVMQLYGTCLDLEFDELLIAAEGPLLPFQAAVESRELPWFIRLVLAINLTRTIDFMHRRNVVLCGMNAEQVAVDSEWNAKLIDLDTVGKRALCGEAGPTFESFISLVVFCRRC